MKAVNEVEEYLKYAERCLASARLVLEDGDFRGSVNRSYYCVLCCAQAVLANEGVAYGKHTAVIAHFRKNYIHTEIFDAKLSDIIGKLFKERNKSDYDMGPFIDEETVRKRIDDAEHFMNEVKKYL